MKLKTVSSEDKLEPPTRNNLPEHSHNDPVESAIPKETG